MINLKKHIFFFLFYVASTAFIFASEEVNVSSSYENGHFITRCAVRLKASDAIVHKMIDDFVRQDKYHLDSLFTWALKDLKLQGEEGEILVYNLKSTVYDADKDIIRGKMDVSVPRVYTVKDFLVDTRVTKIVKNGEVEMYFEVLKADAFVKTTTAKLNITRINKNDVYCKLESTMSFGWFFNIFISQKRYKETAEWRFEQLMKNLKKTAESKSR